MEKARKCLAKNNEEGAKLFIQNANMKQKVIIILVIIKSYENGS